MPEDIALQERPAGEEPQVKEPPKSPRQRRKRSLKIDKDAVVNSVLTRLERDLNERQEWMNKRLDRYAKIRGWLPEKDYPWEDASNAWLPLMASASLRVKSALYNAVMGMRPVMSSRATQRRNAGKQERIDQLLDWQIFVEASGEQRLDDFISNFVDEGTAFAFVRWVRETQTIHDVRVVPGLDDTQDHIPQILMRLSALFQNLINATMADQDGWKWEAEFLDDVGEQGKARIEFFDRDDGRLEAHLRWRARTHDGPAIDIPDLEDIVVPMRSGNLQPPSGANPHGAAHVFRLCLVSQDAVRRRQKDGTYDLLTEEDLKSVLGSGAPMTGRDEEQIKEEKDRQEGMQEGYGADRYAGDVSVVEAYDRWDVDGDGLEEDVIFTIARESRKLMRARLLTEMYPGIPPRRPLAETRFLTEPNRIYGIGLPETLESLQDLMKIILDQGIDWGTIRNTPYFFYRAVSGMKPEIIRLSPGEGYPLDDPSRDVHFPQWGNESGAWNINMIGLLQQFAERLSMMSDVQFGRVPTGKASALRTLGTTISLLAQGDVRTEQILRRLFHGLSQIWQMVHRLNKRYLPNKKEFRIIGIPEAGQDAYMEAAPDDVDADVDFSFRATMLNTNRQMLAQSLMEIAGIVVSPLAIQMGLVDAGKVHAVIRDYIKARDQDPAQYLNRPPAQVSGPKLLAEEALSAILAGEMPEGAPLEPDPAEHLTKLMEFQAGENFGLLSPPQVQIFKAYLRHVVGLVQQAQQQQVLMQAAQQFQQSRGGNGQAPGGVPTTIQPPGAEQTQVGQNELVDESVGAG